EPESRARVSISSVDFDTYLVIELPDGRVLENDDSDGTDSALTLAVSEPGVARVGVTSYGYASTGDYTLEITTVEERTVTVGRVVRGSLEAVEDIYLLRGEPGETVAVELRSDAFDTYLELEADDGTYLYNDDAAGISVSRLVHELGSTGEAVITVSSFGGGTGAYELDVQTYRYEGPLLDDGYPLADGDVVTGELGPHVPMRDGSYVQRFTFRAEPGERVEIVLRSDDFDSYLRVITPRGEEVSDDDSGGGLDSRIILTADERGMYEVLASDLGGGSLGGYTLSFARLSDARMLLSTHGELGREDRVDVRGNFYDVHRFDVTAGRLVTVDVVSDDFDGYAVVRAGERDILYRDDDGGGSGNPRISFTAERSETLELIVTTYSPESTGRYSVSIYE
ncbi:MAG: hypothetical protein ACOC0O_06680, partial [Spirochaetota bacterium]